MAKAPRGPKVKDTKLTFGESTDTFRPKIGQLRKTEFKSILGKQKKKFKEEGDSYIFGETMVKYFDRVRKGYNYTEENLKKEQIRKPVIDYIFNYGLSLDGLRDMGFDEINDFQKVTSQYLSDLKKSGLNDKESTVVTNLVGGVNERLKDLLGVTTRLKFGVKDFLKQFAPLKLLQRYAPGPVADFAQKIESRKDQAERQQQQTRRALIKSGRKSGSISTASSDFGPSLDTESGREEIASRTAMSDALTGGVKTPSFNKETMIEEERESDAQFGETKTILEKILEAQLETNELLGGDKKADGPGFFAEAADTVKDVGLPVGGTGAAIYYRKKIAGMVGKMLKGFGIATPTATKLLNYSKPPSDVKGGADNNDTDKKKQKLKDGQKQLSKSKSVLKKSTSFAKGILKPLAPIIATYDAVTGFMNADEILQAAPEETLTWYEKSIAGLSKALDSFTFGALDASKTARFLTGRRTEEEKLEDRANIPSIYGNPSVDEGASVGMDSYVSTQKADEIMSENMSKNVEAQASIVNSNNTVNSNNVTNNISNTQRGSSDSVPLTPENLANELLTNSY